MPLTVEPQSRKQGELVNRYPKIQIALLAIFSGRGYK